MENSEGVHIEYIAIFLATLFPGALVAFNYETLQSVPQFAVLRIYCAGIWHNAVKADKRKGHCISNSWVPDNENTQVVDHQSTCANDLTLLSTIPCFNMSVLEGRSSEDGQGKESTACLRAKDMFILKNAAMDGLQLK
ncbi:hypothetical protein MKX01_010896 [Papaver californicum]|nr:hypothetical protein MKX01_010896 [Papaver californicum]